MKSPYAASLMETGAMKFEAYVVGSEKLPGQSYANLKLLSPLMNAVMNTSGQTITFPVDEQVDEVIPKNAVVRITMEVL
jgi:hypothetical protein